MSRHKLGHTISEEATLNSRGYNLIRKLGEGSYAKVYLSQYEPVGTVQSQSKENNTQLACKIIDTSVAPKEFVTKFLPRELDILVKLNHPHIIHVHSVLQRRPKYFIFMRHAENGDLLDYVLKNGPIPESQSRIWTRQLALGLQYMHELEIAHRDLKCENVLITANYNAKLADFGFSRYVVDHKGRKVLSETYCGSLAYTAPEVLRGLPYNPKAADMWSLGVIIYIMLDKAMPFHDTNPKKLYDRAMNHKWQFRSKVEKNLTNELKKMIKKLLEPDVGQRHTAVNVVESEWIAMDPRLTVLSTLEKQAVTSANEERKKFIHGSNMKKIESQATRVHDKLSGKGTKMALEKDDVVTIKTPGHSPQPSKTFTVPDKKQKTESQATRNMEKLDAKIGHAHSEKNEFVTIKTPANSPQSSKNLVVLDKEDKDLKKT